MKKFLCCFLAAFLMAAITACGDAGEDAPAESAKPTGQAESSAVTEAEENTHMSEKTEMDTTGVENEKWKENDSNMAEAGIFNFQAPGLNPPPLGGQALAVFKLPMKL